MCDLCFNGPGLFSHALLILLFITDYLTFHPMSSENGSAASRPAALYLQYPVHSVWEMTLTSGETVKGTVYCTDEVAATVFLQKNLTHTTLATELFVVHVSQITKATKVAEEDESSTTLGALPKVQKKALDEREKRAIRMAEESFRHINDKVRL